MPQLRDTPSQSEKRRLCPGKLLMCSSPTLEATQQATLRADMDCLSCIEKLPNELKLMVIVRMDNARSIFNLALTGPQLCAFITVHERVIAENVIKRTIPAELRHIAVATYSAIESPWNVHQGHIDLNSSERLSDPYIDSIVNFVERYRCPGGFTLQAQHPTGPALYEAYCYFVMHNAINVYTNRLVLLSMRSIPKDIGFAPKISPTVLIRYQKALYITQLVAELFAWRGGNQTDRMHMAWGTFWYAFAPWEVEQVYGVQALLTWYTFDQMSKAFSIYPLVYTNWFTSMGAFINYCGPVRLGCLEFGKPPQELAVEFQAFQKLNPARFIHWGQCAPAFGMQIILHRIGRRLSQSAKDGSPAFSDLDIGPMKHWYCLFLNRRLERTAPGNSHSFFSCMRCLILSGYAFWDEIEHSRLPLPSIEEMHKEAVAMFEDVAQRFHGPDGNRVTAMWFRRWENCTSQATIPPHVDGQALPLPRYADEYCFRTIGQILADVMESMRPWNH